MHDAPRPGVIKIAMTLRAQPASASSRTLRPSRQLVVQSRTVAAAIAVPVFAAMIWFGIPRGTLARVLVMIAVISALYLVAIYLLSRVRIVIEPDGITENGFFLHNRRIAVKRIESILLVEVYRGQSLETATQVFVLDASGELLLRMRGQFWSPEAVDALTTAYGVAVRTADDPLTRGQLRSDHPELVYWFERWPWVRVLCLVGAISALSLVLIALMTSTLFA